MWKIIFGLALTARFFVIVPVQAAILYVDNSKACPGNGSSSTPYCSIQNAFNNVNAGDSIRIRTGTGVYDQSATLTRAGTQANRIIIEPDIGQNPMLQRSGGTAEAAVIELRKVSYVTIQNLKFDGAGVNTSRHALWLHASLSQSDGADMQDIQVLNNTFQNWGGSNADATVGATRAALALDGGFCSPACPGRSRNALIQGNTFTSVRQVNILVLHADDTVIQNNTITNAKCGRDVDTATNTIGIKIIDAFDGGSSGTIIQNNSMHDWEPKTNCGVPHVGGAYDSLPAVWCDVGPANGLVQNNTIYNINQSIDADRGSYESQGVFIEAGCSGWVVKKNIIYNIGGAGIRQRMGTTSLTANQYLNNTVYNVGFNGIEIATGKTIIKNNIVYSAQESQIHFDTAQPGLHTIDYNLYWDNSGGTAVGNWGSGVLNFANWKLACNCDNLSVNSNPLFVNPPANLNLQSSSPARSAGEAGIDMGALLYIGGTSNVSVPTAPGNLVLTLTPN